MTPRQHAIDTLLADQADDGYTSWGADQWARWAAEHGVRVTDLRCVRLTSWAALAHATVDKKTRVHALGEPQLPLEAGA